MNKDELKEAIKDYQQAMDRIDKYTQTIADLVADIRAEAKVYSYKMLCDRGAHCTKCGDPIQGDTDSLCVNCF